MAGQESLMVRVLFFLSGHVFCFCLFYFMYVSLILHRKVSDPQGSSSAKTSENIISGSSSMYFNQSKSALMRVLLCSSSSPFDYVAG
jgi:hypothetical protein